MSGLVDAIGGAPLERALAIGTARAPLEMPSALAARALEPGVDWRLCVLALRGQSLRFRRPVAPAWSEPLALPRPDRPLLSDRARRLLIRFAASKPNPSAGIAIGAALDVRRVALHPFDLHRIAGWVPSVPRHRLDAFARAWLARRNARSDAAWLPAEDPEWETASLDERCTLLRTERLRDPVAALARIEQALAGESAAARARYVGVLRVHPSPADRPLLESLRADRAEAVRAAATELLGAIAGTPEHAARVESALALVVRREGAAAGDVALAVRKPGSRRADAGLVELALDAFAGIGLDALAKHCALDPVGLARASRGDHAVATVVADLALRSGDPAPVVNELPDVDWSAILARALRPGSTARREHVAVVRPRLWDELPASGSLGLIVSVVDGPADARLARELLGSAAWRAALAPDADAAPAKATELEAALVVIAALTPASERARLAAALAGVPLATKHRALQLVETLDAIENDEPVPTPP